MADLVILVEAKPAPNHLRLHACSASPRHHPIAMDGRGVKGIAMEMHIDSRWLDVRPLSVFVPVASSILPTVMSRKSTDTNEVALIPISHWGRTVSMSMSLKIRAVAGVMSCRPKTQLTCTVYSDSLGTIMHSAR